MIALVAGPSGAGKSYFTRFAHRLLGEPIVVPFTTRPPRPNEQDGREYHFRSVDEFQQMIREGSFLDWDFHIGHYYGYARSVGLLFDGRNAVLPVKARMALRLWQRFPEARTVFFDAGDERMPERKRHKYVGRIELLRRLHDEEEVVHRPLFQRTWRVRHLGTDELKDIVQVLFPGPFA